MYVWIAIMNILLCYTYVFDRVYFADGSCITVMLSECLLMVCLYRFDGCHLNYLNACVK